MKDACAIFEFALSAAARGERVVLVTVTSVEGRSARAPGCHLVVASSGEYLGSFSGGCVEAAVVGEALRIQEEGRPSMLRLGAGSPYIDIRLPCGGGIDLLFQPDPDLEALRKAANALRARLPVSLGLGRDNTIVAAVGEEVSSGWKDSRFWVLHRPAIKVVILGHGEEVTSLARIAEAYQAEVEILTPDRRLDAAARAEGHPSTLLHTPSRHEALAADSDTAIVALFHDHDWEEDLLGQAAESPAFFVGAMGSRQTHARRVAALKARGMPAPLISRIVGPIGLIAGARDPDTLALSVMAQLVETYERKAEA